LTIVEGGDVTDEPTPSLAVEVATIGELLRLLKDREDAEATEESANERMRRAVFVARLLDRRSSRYGSPLITRRVVVAFAYGRNLISYRRIISNAVELPEATRRIEGRQRETYEEVRAEIGRGLREMGLDVPIYEGSLRGPVEPEK
jgi:hypothetical protein